MSLRHCSALVMGLLLLPVAVYSEPIPTGQVLHVTHGNAWFNLLTDDRTMDMRGGGAGFDFELFGDGFFPEGIPGVDPKVTMPGEFWNGTITVGSETIDFTELDRQGWTSAIKHQISSPPGELSPQGVTVYPFQLTTRLMATSPQGEEFKLTLLAAGVGQTFYFWDEDVFHLAALSLDFSEAPAPVPDPTTFILTATGLTATAWRVRRRRRETPAC